LPDFSSTLTTVPSESAPLVATFTLSPALSGAVTNGLGSGEGLGTGVGVTAFTFGALFAFEFVSVELESQAAKVKDKSSRAKIFLVMIFSPIENENWRLAFVRTPLDSLNFGFSTSPHSW
jgi:hypothetical protein